jgi:hypothetical protein
LVEANNLDKDLRSFHLPNKEMEREHLCDGGFKPPARFQPCAMCMHKLVDKPTKNKSAARQNKALTAQWESDSRKIENLLLGKGECLMDKNGKPTIKIANPKYSEELLMCHCWQQSMLSVSGGTTCIFGCVDQATGKQCNEGECPVCLCDCHFVCTKK